jgi:hypothetical protein
VADGGFAHLLEELARVCGKGLDVAALALGEEGVEGERGLAGAADAGEDDEGVFGEGEVHAAEVVLVGVADGDVIGHGLGMLLLAGSDTEILCERMF